ncbi:MAG: response regulator [Gammaproteobacteria bacterium]|nr:response regulator [Gammaproteobacteria bacterium]MDH5799533.1 response regulator [Gammaproteobacteria bacterium]
MSTILVIDDNVDFRESLADLLRLDGYDVLEAPDGDEGINIYKQNPIDLVITDIVMPNKEGISTIIELKKIQPDVKIFSVSGGGRSTLDPAACLQPASKLGAMYTFQKPIDRTAFMEAVHKAIPH